MVLTESIAAIAVADMLLYAFIITIRALKGKEMADKETRVALSHHWNKANYMSYLLVVFFLLCSIAICLKTLMMTGMLTSIMLGDIPEYINLVLVCILFANGVNVLLLITNITNLRGAKR